jgi:3-methyladenine DNA glycosylase Mpg
LGIARELYNGMDLTRRGSTLLVTDDGYRVSRVEVTPGIRIQKAADLPLRFLISGNQSHAASFACASPSRRK